MISTLDGCGSMEIFSYMTNLLDQFLLKDKSHFFVYEYEKLLLLRVIKKLCVMHEYIPYVACCSGRELLIYRRMNQILLILCVEKVR